MYRKISVLILILVLSVFVIDVSAKNRIYLRNTLTGGGVGALDALDGDLPAPTKHGDPLNDGDKAIVVTFEDDSSFPQMNFLYVLDADSGLAESAPDVITPDTNPGTKRWILTPPDKVRAADVGSNTQMLISDGTDFNLRTLSGDATVDNTGVVTIGATSGFDITGGGVTVSAAGEDTCISGTVSAVFNANAHTITVAGGGLSACFSVGDGVLVTNTSGNNHSFEHVITVTDTVLTVTEAMFDESDGTTTLTRLRPFGLYKNSTTGRVVFGSYQGGMRAFRDPNILLSIPFISYQGDQEPSLTESIYDHSTAILAYSINSGDTSLHPLIGLGERRHIVVTLLQITDYTLVTTDSVNIVTSAGTFNYVAGTDFNCVTSNAVCLSNLETAINTDTASSTVEGTIVGTSMFIFLVDLTDSYVTDFTVTGGGAGAGMSFTFPRVQNNPFNSAIYGMMYDTSRVDGEMSTGVLSAGVKGEYIFNVKDDTVVRTYNGIVSGVEGSVSVPNDENAGVIIERASSITARPIDIDDGTVTDNIGFYSAAHTSSVTPTVAAGAYFDTQTVGTNDYGIFFNQTLNDMGTGTRITWDTANAPADKGHAEIRLSDVDGLLIDVQNLTTTNEFSIFGSGSKSFSFNGGSWNFVGQAFAFGAESQNGFVVGTTASNQTNLFMELNDGDSSIHGFTISPSTTDPRVTIGTGEAGVDYQLCINGEDNVGCMTFDEDSDIWSFGEGISALDGFFETVSGKKVTTTKSANGTLNQFEVRGTTILVTAAVQITIPNQCDSASGAWFTIVVRDAAEVVSLLLADSGDTINVNGLALAAGDELDSSGSAFDSITLECLETNNWYATSKLGAWVDGTP